MLMAKLSVYNAGFSQAAELVSDDFDEIQKLMDRIGVHFGYWQSRPALEGYPSQDQILEYYQKDIERIRADHGYSAADIVRIDPKAPDAEAIRQAQVREHTHLEDEVRGVISGFGLFNIRHQDRVFSLVCAQREIIRIPAGTAHWFECCGGSTYTALRVFNSPDAWLVDYSRNQTHTHFAHLSEDLEAWGVAAE